MSLNNLSCQARPTIADTNFDKPLYYSIKVSVNKCGESCNAINNPCAEVCVSNKVKNMNVNSIPRFLIKHEVCEFKCGSNESVCNSEEKWIMMSASVSVKNTFYFWLIICGILIRLTVSIIIIYVCMYI